MAHDIHGDRNRSESAPEEAVIDGWVEDSGVYLSVSAVRGPAGVTVSVAARDKSARRHRYPLRWRPERT